MKLETTATITCPFCGHHQISEMPTDACQHFFRCEKCGKTMIPQKGDCCVFCSYANSKCPPKQLEEIKQDSF